jgi:hypothetical protein
MQNLLRWFFVAKNVYVFLPNLCMLPCYVKHTFGELIIIFGLSEIFNLNLCMFSFVN